jgi:acetylornithine deacetylase/succinyl-diaminopimelate desuccinylase-like protein
VSRAFYLTIALILVLAAAVLSGLWYSGRTTEEDRLYVPREAVITPEVTLLQQYVRIDTSNPPGLEMAGARFLMDQLQRAGVRAELIESAHGRANVYARIRGKRPGEGLLLLHHIDVITADPKQWEHPPFEAKVVRNMIYGRGTLDMKSIGISQLLAFIDVARSGRAPERDIVFLATADEERGSALGLEWLVRNRPDVIAGVKYALNEGGITEVVREQVVYFAVEIGSKQLVNLRLTSPDRERIRQARLALEPLFEPTDPDRISPEIAEYFRAIAPHRREGVEILRDANRAVEEGKYWNLGATYRSLNQNLLFMTGPEKAGDQYAADASLLNMPEEDPEERIEWFRQKVEPFGLKIEVLQKMGPSAISPAGTPFFGMIEQAVKQSYGQEVQVGPIVLATATTDSRYLRTRGIVAYGLWPFPVDFFQSTGIHGADERVRLDWFVDGVNLVRGLVREYATTARPV